MADSSGVDTAADAATGPMTGARYLASLKDEREVWIDGRRVDDVATHPAFKDMVAELARLYDLQNSPRYRDARTCDHPDTGQRISVSWLFPRSADDLKRKRRNSQMWNELSWGQLGRSPDILAPYIISALHLKAEFGAVKHPKCDFGENLQNYYEYCKRHDLFLTHALGDPQVDRSQQNQNERRATGEDTEVALHVVEEAAEGVVVTGGKQLSTAAPHSHEVYVSLSATFAQRNNPNCVLAFSIPTNSPGLKILAREPVSRREIQLIGQQHVARVAERAELLGAAQRGEVIADGRGLHVARIAVEPQRGKAILQVTAIARVIEERAAKFARA